MNELDGLRGQIDDIDRELLALFRRRMEVTRAVGEYKKAHQLPVLDVERERQVLERKRALAETPEMKTAVTTLYETIMGLSRRQQRALVRESEDQPAFRRFAGAFARRRQPVDRPRVVYQGVPGAYSEMACLDFFGSETGAEGLEQFEDVFLALEEGRADYGVVPIENSSTGAIRQIYDLLTQYEFYIVGETDVKVDHALLGLPGATLEDIRQVYSHPQGLMQCHKFLNEHKGWHQVSVENTAVGAQRVVSENDIHNGAIASSLSGQLYGLSVIKAPLNFNSSNTTRFVIISSRKVYTAAASKLSICFEIAHEIGSLYNILSHFIFNGLNMSKIESRPVPGQTWEYRFFVDFDGNLSNVGVKNALTGISEEAVSMKILGNY